MYASVVYLCICWLYSKSSVGPQLEVIMSFSDHVLLLTLSAYPRSPRQGPQECCCCPCTIPCPYCLPCPRQAWSWRRQDPFTLPIARRQEACWQQGCIQEALNLQCRVHLERTKEAAMVVVYQHGLSPLCEKKGPYSPTPVPYPIPCPARVFRTRVPNHCEAGPRGCACVNTVGM